MKAETAEEYFKKSSKVYDLQRAIELNDMSSIYSMIDEYASQEKEEVESGWISVEDRLPDDNIEVLAQVVGWDDLVYYFVLEMDTEDWIDNDGETVKGVVNWKEITPPKE